jgi:hypothetical protein
MYSSTVLRTTPTPTTTTTTTTTTTKIILKSFGTQSNSSIKELLSWQ